MRLLNKLEISLEQRTGFEPAPKAWRAPMLPLNTITAFTNTTKLKWMQ